MFGRVIPSNVEYKIIKTKKGITIGLLTDFVFKEENKKHKWVRELILWIKELGVLGVFLMLALGLKAEWEAGFKTCEDSACLVCWNLLKSNNTDLNNSPENLPEFILNQTNSNYDNPM